ncbi:ECF transporter S component [Orenia marismortui]|uniref:ECF transporter S component n=1 Tax=Orenia marismortui TaxID=46469 RepID=UPI00035E987D|nr:ECF transporter S component [Orenia marismortui]
MKIKKLSKGGVLLALGVLIPYMFHLTAIGGKVFLPMHFPVLLAGLLLGPGYGLIIGGLTPILNFIISGMPPMPFLILMFFELATYGFLSGLIYKKLNLMTSLITAMLGGRLVYALVIWFGINLFNIDNLGDPLLMVKGSIISSWPGLIGQLILIPTIILALERGSKPKIDYKRRV